MVVFYLICFPAAVKETVQPKDAGYGRSLQCSIGRRLDEWLMNGTNLLWWEENMVTIERYVIVAHLVARAQACMLEKAHN